MATQADVRRIALSFPDTVEESTGFAFGVINNGKSKGIAWVWRERIHPKKARVANPNVLAVAVANLDEKELLLAAHPDRYFTEPHYNGYPAILVRLADVTAGELRSLLANAWACKASAKQVAAYKAGMKKG